MASKYSDSAIHRALQTLLSIDETLRQLIDWNKHITSTDDFTHSQSGMQLLAASAMLISAVGEGVRTINSKLPDFLTTQCPDIPWQEIIGMRNHIVDGYFNLNADIVFDVVKNEIPKLQTAIHKAIELLHQ